MTSIRYICIKITNSVSDNISSVKNCTGCSACSSICPKHCIAMQEDRLGFEYPVVDESACVSCGLCLKTCPVAGSPDLAYPLKAYAARSIDDGDYLTSSSGGAASVLSRHMIKSGGVVYGCASEGTDVRHVRVDRLEGLPGLKGSKYVQSRLSGVFEPLKQDLEDGRDVLFIGTPCQVMAIRRYAGKLSDKLYLADLICHGVPSGKMLKEHVASVSGGRPVGKLSFRNGNQFELALASGEEVIYRADSSRDMYYNVFMRGLSYRNGCYRCLFARPERGSDITIGDFWGIDTRSHPLPFDCNSGLSVMLPVTDKGKRLVEMVSCDMKIEGRSVEEAVNGNSQLRCPTRNSFRGRILRQLYAHGLSFGTAARISLLDKKLRDIYRKIIGRR